MIRVPLPHSVPPVLALGAFLKNTVCVTKGDAAYVGEPVGDLDSAEAIAAFEANAARICEELAVTPLATAHDLHPDFHSTRFAQSLDLPAFAVQHHHAHIAALAAEHGVTGPVIGLGLDGFGLGPGSQSWGGELLLVDGPDYRRLGHLALLPQPGGDVAAREPWRMGAAALFALGRGDEIAARYSAHAPAAKLGEILKRNLNSPLTSSCGRLFDAACGLLGLHPVAQFEGQAPMALEKLTTAPEAMAGGWSIRDGVLDLKPLLAELSGLGLEDGANLFHGTIAAALSDWAIQAAEQHGLGTVALGGGCFLNRVMTGLMRQSFEAHGLTVLTAEKVSPGDAGLSLGQAWVGALSLMRSGR